jgi:hypothetical protein
MSDCQGVGVSIGPTVALFQKKNFTSTVVFFCFARLYSKKVQK